MLPRFSITSTVTLAHVHGIAWCHVSQKSVVEVMECKEKRVPISILKGIWCKKLDPSAEHQAVHVRSISWLQQCTTILKLFMPTQL